MAYDIIGNIHGYAGKLAELLTQTGYCEQNGAWRHRDRTALFVGDLVDRGLSQMEMVRPVQAMVTAGSAKAPIGNLAAMGLKDYAFEAMILRHPASFSEVAVSRSRACTAERNVSIPYEYPEN